MRGFSGCDLCRLQSSLQTSECPLVTVVVTFPVVSALCEHIVMCICVCLFVYLPPASIRSTWQSSPNFHALLTAIRQFFSDSSMLRYVLPVLWMTSCLHIMARNGGWKRVSTQSDSTGGNTGVWYMLQRCFLRCKVAVEFWQNQRAVSVMLRLARVTPCRRRPTKTWHLLSGWWKWPGVMTGASSPSSAPRLDTSTWTRSAAMCWRSWTESGHPRVAPPPPTVRQLPLGPSQRLP